MLIADAASWGEYGALGLAVLALGGFIMFLMKQHYAERKEMLNRQLDERKEWREDAQSRQGELHRVVSSLESVIREQGSK